MRHALAVPEAADLPDAERYLSASGRELARLTLAWLARRADRPTLIATSPVVRAVQTAEIAAAVLGLERVVVVGALITPLGSSRHATNWLLEQRENVLAVGHEPTISGVVAYLLGVTEHPALLPAQIVAVAGGRVVATSPELTGQASAPSSRGAPPSRG